MAAADIDVSAAAGSITPAGIAKSFKARLAEIRKAVDAGDTSRALRNTDALLKGLDVKRGLGVSPETADVLAQVLSGVAPPTAQSVPVGVSSVVVTNVDSAPVVVALPAGTPVAWIRVGGAPAANVARPSGTTRVGSIEVTAFDSFGKVVRQLGGTARISLGFAASTAVNAASARIGTIGLGGASEILSTLVTSGADAYTATASTTHFTPFVIDALTTTPPWRYTYLAPPTITGVTPSSGSICGNTSVVITGTGFSGGTVFPGINDVAPQSFTVDSDTQITLLTSAALLGQQPGGSDAGLSTFYTSTALAPEFANSSLDGDLNPPFRLNINTYAGANYPGTPTFTPLVQPVTPRVSGLTPNQGPTIGAPVHPSQNFSNTPIRINGCGFTGATAVLFGATPSPNFTVQSDLVIIATPPVPASGTVDVRVVTPHGTSSIVP